MPASGPTSSKFPGRELFYRHLQGLLAKRSSLVLVSLDIEGLDFILRTFGPDKRGELSIQVGERILRALDQRSLPFHLTASSFAVPLPDCGWEQAGEIAATLVHAMAKPFKVNGIACVLPVHAGISHYPTQARDVGELVRTAAYAADQARRRQQSVASYDHYSDEQERERFRLMLDLEQALHAQRDIQLVYQPMVELASGRAAGVEALCRWRHPELGPLAPNDFLPYVEQSALILPLTETVLGLGLADLVRWREEGIELRLGFNLSPGLFRQPPLLKRLLEQFRFSGARPEQVAFEIAETGELDNSERTVQALGLLRDWGSRIALDDFGGDHCSLISLGVLPLDDLKIDRQIIQHIEEPWGEAVVSAAVVLAERLGLQTVAEGVETATQYASCRDLGVGYGQGYHIARPMPRGELLRWLRNQAKSA